MSKRPIIRFEQVTKQFANASEQPRSLLESVIATVRRKNESQLEPLTAVKDLTFDVYAGESVGLIGRNGSGKSTLLKLATRILQPTSGRVLVNGRISALLELGAGFHHDLTGRENIYLNGSVLGLSRQAIDERFDEIVAFSELKEYIDMPVKHYSSGMYMRLGFSVAVYCDPEILLIDEILAVGDHAFQRKCIDRIYEMKKRGITIVMVSHDMETMQKLCDSLVWIDRGAMREKGSTVTVSAHYTQFMNGAGASLVEDNDQGFRRVGTRQAEITSIRFLDDDGREQTIFHTGDDMTIELAYTAHTPVPYPEMGFSIFRADGVHINGTNNSAAGLDIELLEGSGKLLYHIEKLPVIPGSYKVSAAIQDARMAQIYDFHEQAYMFHVESADGEAKQGVIKMPASWEWSPDLTKQPSP